MLRSKLVMTFLNYEKNISKVIICVCVYSQTYTHLNMFPTLSMSKN